MLRGDPGPTSKTSATGMKFTIFISLFFFNKQFSSFNNTHVPNYKPFSPNLYIKILT